MSKQTNIYYCWAVEHVFLSAVALFYAVWRLSLCVCSSVRAGCGAWVKMASTWCLLMIKKCLFTFSSLFFFSPPPPVRFLFYFFFLLSCNVFVFEFLFCACSISWCVRCPSQNFQHIILYIFVLLCLYLCLFLSTFSFPFVCAQFLHFHSTHKNDI